MSILNLPDSDVFVTDSGLFVEWHEHGMNIELRIRETGMYLLVEDKDNSGIAVSGTNKEIMPRLMAFLHVLEARNENDT